MDTLGGYRLVRRLGSGQRAEVWLGHDGDGVAAVKVFRTGVERHSIDTEIEALGRASSRHLARLSDLATAPDGVPCLILDRLSPSGLGRVLAHRTVTAGEAVTIVAPIALAVAELHRVGVAHGAIGARAVLFDEDGAPVLSCFGAATLVGGYPDPPTVASLTVAQLASNAEVVGDLQQLAELTGRVLLGVREGGGVCEWLGRSDAAAEPEQWPMELAERLFRIAEPTPVLGAGALDGPIITGGAGLPGALVPRPVVTMSITPSAGARQPTAPHARAGRSPLSAEDGGQTSRLAGIVALPPSVVQALALWKRRSGWWASVRTSLGSVRPRIWVIAGAVMVVAAAGSAILWSVAQPATDRVSGSSNAAPGGARTSAAPTEHSDPAREVLIASDDPVIAATALLSARRDCFTRLSVLCLDGVDQAESAAYDADSYAIRLAQQGSGDPAGVDYSTGTIELVESLGDTVLLSITATVNGAELPPASLLLVRGEAGWLIRDLIAADGGVSG